MLTRLRPRRFAPSARAYHSALLRQHANGHPDRERDPLQAVAPDIGEEDLADDALDRVADVVAASVVDALEVSDWAISKCAGDDRPRARRPPPAQDRTTGGWPAS